MMVENRPKWRVFCSRHAQKPDINGVVNRVINVGGIPNSKEVCICKVFESITTFSLLKHCGKVQKYICKVQQVYFQRPKVHFESTKVYVQSTKLYFQFTKHTFKVQ